MTGLRMAAPLDALARGATPWRVGLLLALFAAAPVLLAMAAGRLADRWGFHRPVHIAGALCCTGLILAAVSATLKGWPAGLLLAAGAVAAGAGANIGLIAVQRTGGMTARDPVERVRVFSWLGIAPSLANVIGPVTVGLLIDAGGFAVAYASLLVLPLASLLAARAVPVAAAPGAARPGGGAPLRELFALPGMKRLLAVNWLLSMCWDVHGFAVPILGHERGFSATTIGLVLGSFTLSVTGVRVLIPLLARHLQPARVVAGAMLGTAMIFAVYPLVNQPWLMGACAVALGVTLGCVQPMLMTVLHHLTPEDRHGQALAFRSMTINGSSTVMPLLFGAAGAAIGAASMFWIVGTLVGSGAWLARRLRA
ncbi:MAG: MFS transporter [Burkholderiaceae bacterium]|nr:MFS transporter [Burkholderiaceae bacterium]